MKVCFKEAVSEDTNRSLKVYAGASAGIGAGTAVEFAKLGAKVAITGRNAENLEKTAQKCREVGGKDVSLFNNQNI